MTILLVPLGGDEVVGSLTKQQRQQDDVESAVQKELVAKLRTACETNGALNMKEVSKKKKNWRGMPTSVPHKRRRSQVVPPRHPSE